MHRARVLISLVTLIIRFVIPLMDPHSFEGESVHGKTMTPLFIIDPCVEIVNPICYYCYQSIKGNYLHKFIYQKSI